MLAFLKSKVGVGGWGFFSCRPVSLSHDWMMRVKTKTLESIRRVVLLFTFKWVFAHVKPRPL